MKMSVASSPLSYMINSNSAMPVYSCTDCTYKTSSVRKLGRHKSVNHAGVKYRCEHCDFVTGYQSNYYRHRKQVHSAAYQIQQTSKNQPNVVIIQQHSSPHQANRQKLSQSANSFATNSSVVHGRTPPKNVVISTSASKKTPIQPTADCSMKVLQQTPPKSHGMGEEWICSECGADFTSKSRLREHFDTNHVNFNSTARLAANQSFNLSRSDMPRFDDVSMIQQELLKAASIEYLATSNMRPRFSVGNDDETPSPLNLAKSNVEFDDDEEFDEDLETKSNISTKSEKNDALTPDFDGMYRCSLCPYTTSESTRFRKHNRCHQTTAPTKCQYCNFSTVYSWNLDRHVRCHKIPARYTCRRCSFSQNTRQSMSFHLQHHHTVEADDAASQTEITSMDSDQDIQVDVGYEPFIFEKHAVVRNENFEDNSECNSPSEIVAKKSTKAVHQANNQITHIKSESAIIGNEGHPAYRSLNKRKYLSEREAIELPSDKFTFEETNDPDIKNRYCSICGYQGKWISEMIRHKRVHTSERPFKCKYCDRTSKWKADLIRHVAKVHGIRVVSKYSRSHTFDADVNVVRALKEAHKNEASDGSMISDVCSDQGSYMDRCEADDADDQQAMDEGRLEIVEDEEKRVADIDELSYQRQVTEFAQQLLFAHMASLAASSTPPGGLFGSAAAVSPSEGELKDLRDLIGGKQLSGALEKYITVYQSQEGEPVLKCRICPYETRDLHTFRAHTQKHENKKPYQCSSCGYRSNWSSDVHKHIRLKKTGHERAFVIKLNENDSSSTSPTSNTIGATDSGDEELLWKCAKCDFNTEDGRTEIVDHLRQMHNAAPYTCRICKFNSLYRKTLIYHAQSVHNCTDETTGDELVVDNLICTRKCDETRKSSASSTSTPGFRTNAGIFGLFGKNGFSGPPNVVVDKNETLQVFKRAATTTSEDVPRKIARKDVEMRQSEESECKSQADECECKICPFKSSNAVDMQAHTSGHERPKGLMCYKCVFCDWFAKKKPSIVEHLKVHTNDPMTYMAEVERNLITPLSHKAAADDDNAANALKGLSGVEKKFKCDECGFATNFVKNLDSHVAVHHSKRLTLTDQEDVLDLSNNNNKIKQHCGSSASVAPNLTDFRHASGVYRNMSIMDSEGEAFIRSFQQQNSGKVILKRTMANPVPALLNDNHHQKRSAEVANSFVRKSLLMDSPATPLDDEQMSEHEEAVDPEAYIHAGEDGLGDEQLFAEMVPKDIQKVNAVVDGQVRKMWQCRYCSHVSKRRANIRMHEKKHFKPNAVGLLKCPKCNYRGDKRSLKIHYRNHITPSDYAGFAQRFQCNFCPATFRKQEVLDVHAGFHGGHNRYRCSQCSYAVPSQQQLSQHVQVHKTRSPPNAVALKSTSSPKLAQLNGNNGVSIDCADTSSDDGQQGSKMSCKFCLAKFADRGQLDKHEYFHGADLTYKCTVCDYSVPFPIVLTKHLKAHHGVQDDDDVEEESVTAELENEAFEQLVQSNSLVDESNCASPNGLKIKINLGKLASQSV